MAFYAHKREGPDGEPIRQTVYAHLVGTAQRAGQCLRSAGLENTGYLAGLLHDMGKYTEAFQRYLEAGDPGQRGSVIHTFQGCRYIMDTFHGPEATFPEIVCAELIAFAIGAHHGLFDCVDPAQRLGLPYRCEKRGVAYEAAAAAFLSEVPEREIRALFKKAAAEVDECMGRLDETYADDRDYAFETGLLARLLLSAVIEGDRCDTAAFMNGARPQTWPEDMGPVWEKRLEYLEGKLAQFPQETPVQKARHAISERCRAFASRKPGIFRLNVPTGGGKTLSSLRYALAHGVAYHKKRLIFVSPLLSILEQNAKVIHAYVGDEELILEHHSNVVQTGLSQEELDERELLVQSWEAPIIITTLVQLLNTLFAGKTTAVRRFQALCGSVVVIDEVQTVPAKMLTLFNLAIQFLSEQCAATVVLCSATQPELECAAHPLREKPEEMVPRDEALWVAFRRTELVRLPDRRLEELPEWIGEQMETVKSLLVVCNKKSEAAYLLEKTKSAEYRSFHLSAGMCVQNRRDVLENLRRALARGEKVLCIATQVIEAGVDISFDAVVRLTAGMDSVVQAAGRCNRGGESQAPRPVYAVNCSDEKLGMLRDIQRGKDATLSLMEAFQRTPEKFGGDLFSEEAIRYYYRAVYRDMAEGEQDYYVNEQGTSLFDLMADNRRYADEGCAGAELFCLRQAFKTAGRYFSVFQEDTTDVLVPYGRGKELIAELCGERCRYDAEHRAAVLREAAAYCVGLYPYQKKRLEEKGTLHSVCGDCAWVLAEGFYDDALGLVTETENREFMEV